jgi:hypothetical protein
MNDERIKEIIEAFDYFDGSYKRAEMDEALTFKEEITPHLIRILEEIAANPKVYVAEDRYANAYVVALLAHFKEPAAHLPIIRAFLIDDEPREELWGDMVTEPLPALLFQTCGGSLAAIKELVINKDADEFVRGSAVEALTYAVARGIVERQEVIDFLTEMFTGSEAGEGSLLWSMMASAISALHPEGAMNIIRRAYEERLVDPTYIGLREIEAKLLENQEATLERLRERVDHYIPTDIHQYLGWFACFKENDRGHRPFFMDENPASPKKQKTSKSSKKKMAKKSRKKNRKK